MALSRRLAVLDALARGQRAAAERKRGAAFRWFDRALALDPNCAQALLSRACLALLAKNQRAAWEDIWAMERLDFSRLPDYRDLTTPSAKEFPELLSGVERLIQSDCRRPWAYVLRAFCLRSLLRYEPAVIDLDRSVALAPKSAVLRALRARVKLTNRGSYDGVKDMEKAVAMAPHWGWLRCWLGEALRHQGRFKEALKVLDRGLALEPGYSQGWAWRGGVKVSLGRFRDALPDLNRSLRPDPAARFDPEMAADQRAWALNQKMLALRALARVPEALRCLNEAHRLGPRYGWAFGASAGAGLAELCRFPRLAWARAWRGWIFLRENRPAEALAELEQVSIRHGWPAAWKGKALLSVGRPADALAALDQAVRRTPDYAPAWGWRGEARLALGRPKAAESDLTKAIILDHRCAWAYCGRGYARLALRRRKEARADFGFALGILPGYPDALAGLKK